MTTRCHIPLLKYCSTIVFTLVHNTGLVSHLKPGIKLVRTVNSLLSFYPLNSYIFIQVFFRAIQPTFFFPRRIRFSQAIQAQGSQVMYTASESYVFGFKWNKVLQGGCWGFLGFWLFWFFFVFFLFVIGLMIQKTKQNTLLKMIMQNSKLLVEKKLSSDSCTHSSKGRTYPFGKVYVFSKTNFFWREKKE